MAETAKTNDAPSVLPVHDFHSGEAQAGHQGPGLYPAQPVVEREDTASIRGMVKTVPHLVRIVE